NPKISGTKHNVFGIQAGVAISFMVKKELNDNNRCKIFYTRRSEFETADEKLNFIATNKFNTISFEHITPDNNNKWMNLNYGDFYSLIPLADKETKATNLEHEEKAVFKLFSFGVSTNRDEWVYDLDPNCLIAKIELFSNIYNKQIQDIIKNSWSSLQANIFLDYSIKWSKYLKCSVNNRKIVTFKEENIVSANYRPYFKIYYYADFILSDGLTSIHAQLFGENCSKKNLTICLTVHQQVPFVVQATDCLFDAGLGSRGTQGLSLYRYDKEGNRIDNITDWGLSQFQNHYNDLTITKLDIFHYTYAVLHNPAYRTKYELKLKEEFPRLPFYDDFHKWVNWGKQLMDLHINYETVKPYPLKRIDLPLAKDNNRIPKAKLKADAANGTIILDDVTTLEGVPKIAWEYRLGNRCALEWILDQYKEKKPKDPTIAEKFNTYRFADYKEQVIDLLQRVCTVSVETMQIIQQIEV
ncbi:MAG: type ISP restriction/modification enzyme, partial [Nostoc sp.]